MSAAGPRWVQGRVSGTKRWTDTLFSLQVEAELPPFEAGQFTKLALPAGIIAETVSVGGTGADMIERPYSFVNAPGERPHEFYCVIVPGGPLSPRLALLEAGAAIYVMPRPTGFLVLREVPDAATLWLISTGTGLGPFLSILHTEMPWKRYGQVVLVHSVRYRAELAYRDEIAAIAAARGGRFRSVSLLSRDQASDGPDALAGRIPQAITDGRIEAAAGLALRAADSQVMICGNPAMTAAVTNVLKARGMKKHRRRDPGHITVENYW